MKLIKEIWSISPFSLFIGLITRLVLVSTSLTYLDSIGRSSLFLAIIMNLWALTPLYFSLRSFYYSTGGTQDKHTLLWNTLEQSSYKLEKASQKRIDATKQRIWVERNPEIHIFNYWFLKHLRRKEWMNINLEDVAKQKSKK